MARQRTVASRHAHDAAPVVRDDLLGRLRRAVDGAVAGRGLAVLLTGEAGIGKTTLLREAARYAEGTGARAAWGWGWPGEGTPCRIPSSTDLAFGALPYPFRLRRAVRPAGGRHRLW